MSYKNFSLIIRFLKIKIIKKFLPLFLVFISCSTSNSNKDFDQWAQDNGRLKILSTTVMVHDIVRSIGGQRIDAIALIKGDLDPHSYELVKGDLEKIQYSDIIFYNGLGLEHGASLYHSLKKHKKSIPLGDLVFQKNSDKILIQDGAVDPHIWIDVSLWMEIVDPVAETLACAKPEFAKEFFQNAKVLKKQMKQIHEKIFFLLQKIPSNRRFLVTSHDAFNYFARSYLAEKGEKDWKKRFQAPEGLAPDGQLSSHDIQEILDHLKNYQIHVIFPESNVSKDSIYKIISSGREIGLDVKIANEVLFGDAILDSDIVEDCYLQAMMYNAEVIYSFLNGS